MHIQIIIIITETLNPIWLHINAQFITFEGKYLNAALPSRKLFLKKKKILNELNQLHRRYKRPKKLQGKCKVQGNVSKVPSVQSLNSKC